MFSWADIRGKTVLVGVRNEIAPGEFEYMQYFGVLESMDDVIRIRQEDGSIMTIPPDLNSFEKAEPGVYRLKCSGEHITNPDLISCWSVGLKKRKGRKTRKVE